MPGLVAMASKILRRIAVSPTSAGSPAGLSGNVYQNQRGRLQGGDQGQWEVAWRDNVERNQSDADSLSKQEKEGRGEGKKRAAPVLPEGKKGQHSKRP